MILEGAAKALELGAGHGEQHRKGGKAQRATGNSGKPPRLRAARGAEFPNLKQMPPDDPHGLDRHLEPRPIPRLAGDFPVKNGELGVMLAIAKGAGAEIVLHVEAPVVGHRAEGNRRG